MEQGRPRAPGSEQHPISSRRRGETEKIRAAEWKRCIMKQKSTSYKIQQYLMFAGPGTLLFFGAVIVPFVYGLYLTMTSWDGISKVKPFVGFENFVAAFKDVAYWQAMGRTAVYSFFAVILINIVAFALAYLVTSGVKGQNFFRAGFFVPNLIGGIVLGYVWKPSLLSTPNGAMFCLILVSVWQYAGYMMLIYVAGFMSVSKDVQEAAMIDGCNPMQTMRNVTIPLMRSSFVQCLFLSITRCFVVYDVNLSLTKGEPFNSSVLAAMHVYNQAFTYKNYGVGQAEALILFLVCAIVGVTQVMVGKKGEVDA